MIRFRSTEGIEEFGVRDPDPAALIPFLKSMEFTTLLRRAAAKLGVEDAEGYAAPESTPTLARTETKPVLTPPEPKGCPGAVMDRALLLRPIDYGGYECIADAIALDRRVAAAHESGTLAISVETDSADPMRARLIGIALATAPGTACYIPLAHRSEGGLELAGSTPAQLPESHALAALAPLFEDESILKIGHNLKFAFVLLAQRGASLARARRYSAPVIRARCRTARTWAGRAFARASPA